jgi:hypothetical protein
VAPSGDARADAFLRRFVGAVEAAVAGRVRGYYLVGSYADGTAVAVSDLDLVVLVRGHLDDAVGAAVRRLGDQLAPLCPARLDLTVSGEADATRDKPFVKYGGRLVAGEDVRDRLVLAPPAPRDTWGTMRAAQFHIAEELRGAARVAVPPGRSHPPPRPRGRPGPAPAAAVAAGGGGRPSHFRHAPGRPPSRFRRARRASWGYAAGPRGASGPTGRRGDR